MQGGVIQTERLTLRPLIPADAGAVARALSDWEVTRWLTRVPYPYGPADAAAFIAANLENVGVVWAIADAAGLAGIVGMKREFGYWLARRAWGQGYATECGRAVLTHHFADLAAQAVVSGHIIGNHRSAHVLQKLGFRVTGHEMVQTARGDEVPLRRMVRAHAV
jgi:RimJ/RimL family protein N-acetyltransferase